MGRRAVRPILMGPGREQAQHVAGPHVERPLVWMETVSLIPVDAVEAERQGCNEQCQQQKIGPPQTA